MMFYFLMFAMADFSLLEADMQKTIAAEKAHQGNPLESASVIRRPFQRVIQSFTTITDQLPKESRNLKRQAKSLQKNSRNIFWYHGLKWQMLRAAKNGTEHDNNDIFKSSINPRLLDPEVRKKQVQEFNENDRLIYVENFFDEQTFARMQKEAARLWTSPDLEINCNLDGANRLGGYVLDPNMENQNSFYNLVYANLDFASWISEIYQTPMFPSDFPIELREYGVKSVGMPCHRDLLLYKNAKQDAEFLFTLFNNSTCKSTYIDVHGVEHSVETKPNSLIMVQPEACMHCVSCKPTTPGGIREVMKWIYTGTYEKAANFDLYTENRCGTGGDNSRELLRRRSAAKSDSRVEL